MNSIFRNTNCICIDPNSLDVAAIFTSRLPSSNFIDKVWMQLWRLWKLMLNEDGSWITCEISLWSRILRVCVRRTRYGQIFWGPISCFIVRLPPLHNHYDSSFLIFRNVQHNFLSMKIRVWRSQIDIGQFKMFWEQWCDTKNSSVSWELHHAMRHLNFAHISVSSSRFYAVHQWSNPKNQARDCRPWGNLYQAKKFRNPMNCVKLMFVSCTCSLLNQMRYFQMCTMIDQKSISSLQDLPQSQSLEIVPICIVVLRFQTTSPFAFNREMDVRDQTSWRFAWSCSWSHVQVRWLTKEFQVHQFVLNTAIAGKFENIFWTIPYQFQFFSSLNWWSSTHKVVIFLSCWVIFFANSQKIPSISWRDLPYILTWPSISQDHVKILRFFDLDSFFRRFSPNSGFERSP